MKSSIFSLVALLTLPTFWARAAGLPVPDTKARLTMFYDQPATHFTQSLPLGNGRLGAMVFGDPFQERIVLNEISLWSGRPQDADRPQAHQNLPEIRRLLQEGKNAEAQRLVLENFTCLGPGSGHGNGANVPYGCYQVLANLHLSFPTNDLPSTTARPTAYGRTLDLSEAIARVHYESGGVRFEREMFSSAPDQVMALRLTADRSKAISFEARLDRPERFQCRAAGNELLVIGRLNDGTGHDGMAYASRLRVIATGGTVTPGDGGTVRVDHADQVILLITAATDYRGFAGRQTGDPVRATLEDMDRAAAKSWPALRAAHVADYQSWFNRVSLWLDDGRSPSAPNGQLSIPRRLVALQEGGSDPALMSLYFQYGRYLLISSSRPGGLPANLQGLWAEEIQTPWNGDYHLDINVQMNYWPAEVGNLSELHEPFFKLVESLQSKGAETAKAYYNTRGWVAHVITNPWGYTSPGEHASWGATVSGSAWLCQHLWEHYAFTEDREFLKWAYPLLKGAALFYLDLLIEEPKHGWLVTAPSNSPENSYRTADGFVGQVCMGPAIDEQLLRNLFGNCARAAEILQVDADLRRDLLDKRARLAPNQIGSDGQLLEWLEEYAEPEPHHRHVSHLWGLYPGDEITLEATPDFARAARKALERRGDSGTGWSLAWKVAFWARLGEGDHAHKILRGLLKPAGGLGFAYNGGGSGSYANLFCAHPPFQIDGNFGGCAGIAEMLLQSQGGVIRLLPALPQAWPVGKVTGLRARGGFTLDMAWSKSLLTEAVVVSDRDQPCTVKLAGRQVTLTDSQSQRVPLQIQGEVARFTARKGERYLLRTAERGN